MDVPRDAGGARPITVGGTTVAPGERAIVDLPVARMFTHTALSMPVEVINGRRPGPTLFVCAAVHGDELNGIEIVRRLLRLRTVAALRGRLIAVPIVNVHGFLDQSRYLPDRRDLNRAFPGRAQGSIAARIAHLVATELLVHADCGIDIHTGALHRWNLPQVRADLDDARTLELARAFGVPVIINANLRDGSLREHAARQGIAMLLYEAGEALRFDELAIRGGVRGVVNVMRSLGMLPARAEQRPAVEPVVARQTRWIRAPSSGIVRFRARPGQRVQHGDTLATIGDPFGAAESAVAAPFAGIVIGRGNLPLANEGDALFNVAAFERIAEAESTVDEFHAQYAANDPIR